MKWVRVTFRTRTRPNGASESILRCFGVLIVAVGRRRGSVVVVHRRRPSVVVIVARPSLSSSCVVVCRRPSPSSSVVVVRRRPSVVFRRRPSVVVRPSSSVVVVRRNDNLCYILFYFIFDMLLY